VADGKGMLIIGGIVVLGGIVEIGTAVQNRLRAQKSRTWPRAEGVVIYRSVASTFIHGIGKVPKVRYSFEAAGQRWEHDHVVFGGHRAMKRAEAERVLRRYPIDAKVQVIFDPADPRVCALESDSAFLPPLAYGIAMVLAGAAVMGAVFVA
jgi:hypothetical protein